MALDQDDTKYETTDALDLFNDDYTLTLAAGELHNKFVAASICNGLDELAIQGGGICRQPMQHIHKS